LKQIKRKEMTIIEENKGVENKFDKLVTKYDLVF